MDKASLRRRFQQLRDGLSPAIREEASEQICQSIARLATSRRLHRVGVFHPFRSEVDLRPLVRRHPDWTFYFPRVSATHPPRLSWGCEPLEPGMWGLLEPVRAPHLLPPVDLLLVPGLAFDPHGFRLGYGGGFYDALLAHLQDTVLSVAVGFDLQRTHRLPVDPMDQPVHGLVTEEGLTWFTSPDA